MNETTLSWHIDQSAEGDDRLCDAPWQAYFYWKRDGRTIRSASFEVSDLKLEVERLQKLKEEVPLEYCKALERLKSYKQIA